MHVLAYASKDIVLPAVKTTFHNPLLITQPITPETHNPGSMRLSNPTHSVPPAAPSPPRTPSPN